MNHYAIPNRGILALIAPHLLQSNSTAYGSLQLLRWTIRGLAAPLDTMDRF